MVGPIRRCRGSQQPAALGSGHNCGVCRRVRCHVCGKWVALYPKGTLVVHLPY